jgi:hypothetical protein
MERFADLHDPRSRHGRLYPFTSILGLCIVAMLAGNLSIAAISQFGRLRGYKLGHALGFKNGRMPCANAIALLLQKIDPDHLDLVLGEWIADRHEAGWDHIAIDGKVLKGSRDGEVPAVHLLAAYAPQASAVIAQMTVEASTNEHKAALRMLGVLAPMPGTVFTLDAMFTHTDVAQEILDKEGDYILIAKKNQPTLLNDLCRLFTSAESGDFSPSDATRLGR